MGEFLEVPLNIYDATHQYHFYRNGKDSRRDQNVRNVESQDIWCEKINILAFFLVVAISQIYPHRKILCKGKEKFNNFVL